MKIRVDGLDELNKQLGQLAKCFQAEKVEKASLASAKIISSQAKANAPRGPTGNLKRANVAKLLGRSGSQPAPAIAAVDRKIAPHAHLVEKGTSKTKANPFFRKAIDAKGEEALNKLISQMGGMVDEAVK